MKYKPEKAAALKYRKGDASAPRLVAKGRGKVAEKIIALAKEHNIPIKEDKELVKARIGELITDGVYPQKLW